MPVKYQFYIACVVCVMCFIWHWQYMVCVVCGVVDCIGAPTLSTQQSAQARIQARCQIVHTSYTSYTPRMHTSYAHTGTPRTHLVCWQRAYTPRMLPDRTHLVHTSYVGSARIHLVYRRARVARRERRQARRVLGFQSERNPTTQD
jgi:hypothetical protein